MIGVNVLEGLTVVDLAGGISGSYAAKLVGDLGARVVRVEPVSAPEEPTPSWTQLYCNTGKLGVTLDPSGEGALDLLVRILALADVAVVDSESPYWDMVLGLQQRDGGFVDLQRLITVLVSPYGQTGERAGYLADHLNTFHAGGEGYLLPGGLGFELFPDRPPIQAGGRIAEYDAGLAAACAMLAAVLTQNSSEPATIVDVSKQDVQVTLGRQYVTTLDSSGAIESRASRAYSAAGMFVCSDGYVFIYASEDHFWRSLADLIGRPEWKDDPLFSTRAIRTENWSLAEPTVVEWVASRTQAEVHRACRSVGIPASIYLNAPEILASDNLRAREFFHRLDHPVAGPIDYPGAGFSFSGVNAGPSTSAPLTGADNAAVFGDLLGMDSQTLDILRKAGTIS